MDLLLFIIAVVLAGLLFWVILKPRTNLAAKTRRINYKITMSTASPNHITELSAAEIAFNETQQQNFIILANFKLCDIETNRETIAAILRISQSVPRPHPVMSSLLKEIDNPDELTQLVNSDPEIAAKILQTVNSAAFGLPQKITRLNQALLLLGTRMVRDIALRVAIQDRFKSDNPEQNKAIQKIWQTSFVASSIGFILAKQLFLSNAAELSTQILLLSIGDVAILSCYPHFARYYLSEEFSLFAKVVSEQEELSVNAALVGTTLAGEWSLPALIAENIQGSLIPMAIPPEKCSLSKSNLHDIIFCYTLCRIGELLVYHNIQDITEIDLMHQAGLEFSYLPRYLTSTKLDKMNELLREPQITTRINQIIRKMNYPSVA